MESCPGLPVNSNSDCTLVARTHFTHLQALVNNRWQAEWDDLLAPDHEALIAADGASKVVRLGHEVAVVLRRPPNYGVFSLCQLIEKLQAGQVLRSDAGGARVRDNPAAHSLVFSIIGWISLLYIPDATTGASASRSASRSAPGPDPGPATGPATGPAAKPHPGLRIALPSQPSSKTVAGEMASRPLDQLLRAFGDIMPKKVQRHAHVEAAAGGGGNGNRDDEAGLRFEVVHLNVAALQDMARVKIVWIDTLGDHLKFETIGGQQPKLYLFKCPSFCKLHHSDASLLDKLLVDFYDEVEKPSHDFCTKKLVEEIILSYGLLFGANTRSRRIYASKERARAALTLSSAVQSSPSQPHPPDTGGGGHQTAITDPYLDELCGYGGRRDSVVSADSSNSSGSGPGSSSGSVERNFYNTDDFSVFQDRLRRIQDYMKSLQPTSFRTLWLDQRDLRLWYTVWVVLFLTVIGIVIAIVSAVLAGVQIQLAKKS